MELQTNEEVNKWYNHGVSYLEASMGIKLSLIEKVRFRELVRDSILRNNKFENPLNRFCLGQEAIAIFLYDYYGVPYPSENSFKDWLVHRWSFEKENGYDGYSEFWKKRQEQSHLP